MSLRASEEARPDVGHHHHHDAQPVVAEQRFLALLEGVATGCGPSASFGGNIIPCGIICSRGKPSQQTLGSTYVVTSRNRGDLNGNARFDQGPVVAVQSLAVKNVLNTALHVKKYRNVYTYKVGLQHKPFDAEVEMRNMEVEDWTSHMTGHGLDEAFNEVHEVCTKNYGKGNYTLRSFRKRG